MANQNSYAKYGLEQLDNMWLTLSSQKPEENSESAKIMSELEAEIESRVDAGAEPTAAELKKSMSLSDFNEYLQLTKAEAYTKEDITRFTDDVLYKANAESDFDKSLDMKLEARKQLHSLKQVTIVDDGHTPVEMFVALK